MWFSDEYLERDVRERVTDAVEAGADKEELRQFQTDLRENHRVVSQRFDRAMISFALIAAAFILVAQGYLITLKFLGNQIENGKVLLPVLLPIAAFHYYRGMQSQVLSQAIFFALGALNDKLQPELSARRLMNLLTPPFHHQLETTNITGRPSYHKADEMRGLLIWFIYALGPASFLGWAMYTVISEGPDISDLSVLSIVIAGYLTFRGIFFAYRAMTTM